MDRNTFATLAGIDGIVGARESLVDRNITANVVPVVEQGRGSREPRGSKHGLAVEPGRVLMSGLARASWIETASRPGR